MDAPLIHSDEASPLYSITMFYNIVVSILSMGLVPNMFSIMCSVSTRGGVWKNVMNAYSFHCAERTAIQLTARLGDTGSTVSIQSLFSFYGAEDYCTHVDDSRPQLGRVGIRNVLFAEGLRSRGRGYRVADEVVWG